MTFSRRRKSRSAFVWLCNLEVRSSNRLGTVFFILKRFDQGVLKKSEICVKVERCRELLA